jgi:hypothetical protein
MDDLFRRQLVGAMKAERMGYRELAGVLGVSVNTLYRRRDEPETITLKERRLLLKIFPDLKIE